MAWKGLHWTTKGLLLLNKCVSSGDFRITRVELGSGKYTGALEDSQGCVEPATTFGSDELYIYRTDNITTVEVHLSNEHLKQGFYYREHAIYASDGQTECCFLYDNAGNDAEYINDANGAATRNIEDRISFSFMVSEKASVNVSYAITESMVRALSVHLEAQDFSRQDDGYFVQLNHSFITPHTAILSCVWDAQTSKNQTSVIDWETVEGALILRMDEAPAGALNGMMLFEEATQA